MINIATIKHVLDDWQIELQQSITSADELFARVGLPGHLLDFARKAEQIFPVHVSPAWLRQIRSGDINDPLLNQVLPLKDELRKAQPGWSSDPLKEDSFVRQRGLIQKYHGRALIIATGHCAINCRYCFRRNFDYASHRLSTDEWQAIFTDIAQDSSIEELILSGGDPLGLSDRRFSWMLDNLAQIPHLRTLRIHTRYPVVVPKRFTQGFCEILEKSSKAIVLVTHINHAQEISQDSIAACKQLRSKNVTLLNQSVLLKGINSDANSLVTLSKSLFSCGILPYYLHMPDQVFGTQHFDVNKKHAIKFIKNMRSSLPGYLVPRLVKEVPGESGKVLIL